MTDFKRKTPQQRAAYLDALLSKEHQPGTGMLVLLSVSDEGSDPESPKAEVTIRWDGFPNEYRVAKLLRDLAQTLDPVGIVDVIAAVTPPPPGPIWYLATPYMGYDDPHMAPAERLDMAFAMAAENAKLLMLAGVPVYAPIVHGHAIASTPGGRYIGEQAWLAHGRAMMRYCCGLIRCELPGWQNSKGMEAEEKWFTENSRPVVPMTPGKVPLALLPQPAASPSGFAFPSPSGSSPSGSA